MEELLLLDLELILLLQNFDVSLQGSDLLLLRRGLRSQTVNCLLERGDTLLFDIIAFIVLVELLDQAFELLFLLLDIDVVGLQILVFLLPESGV